MQGKRRGTKPNLDHKKLTLLKSMAALQTPDDCQGWTGNIDRKGYGRIWFGGRWRLAHDVMWEVIKGPLDESLTLDHFLMNWSNGCSKSCVNLYHLDPVPNAVNVMRGGGICARHARQTHCKHGHEFTPENTKATRRGGRECWACYRHRLEQQRKDYANGRRDQKSG